MDYTEIIYDVDEGIATVTLNRPEKLNAWTPTMEREYRHALSDAEGRDEVKVIIVTGAGRGFCAGADMATLSNLSSGKRTGGATTEPEASPGKNNPREDFSKRYSFVPAIGKPIIGAINGAAVGLGLIQTLYYDLRFASENAKIGTIFAQKGLVAEHGVSWLLPRIVGMGHAMDLILSGRIILAREAESMGLVNKVYPADELMDRVREYAKMLIATSSPRSHREMKREVWNAQFQDLGSSIEEANKDMVESFTCADFKEGVQSYLEKRPPQFTGK
jgi:enoyl-CoA hydratase/carnithine racemase